MSEKVFKTRNWMSIVYPESAPENWLTILEETCIPSFVSPLHDSDLNEDGTQKKEHYHVIIMFDGPKTEKNAQDIFDSFGAIKCLPVHSLKGQVCYLCHLNSPTKHLYNIEDVIALNGANYQEIIDTITNYQDVLKEIQFFISDNHIKSFASLADYAVEYNREWYTLITEKYSYFLDKYIKSKTWTLKKIELGLDPESAAELFLKNKSDESEVNNG